MNLSEIRDRYETFKKNREKQELRSEESIENEDMER